ncbi:MAG: hypothetical protein Q9225_004934 [Loekoesia sp. 1 TL-2023]
MAATNALHDRLEGWQSYPANAGIAIAPPHAENPLTAGLIQANTKIFSDTIDLRIIDFAKDGSSASTRTLYKSAQEVEALLFKDATENPRIRIILRPLRITDALMRKLLTFYKVDSHFLNVLFSFGIAPHLSESGSSNISSRCTRDGSRSLSYQLRYCEENFRSKIQPYSPRQTGIYHRHAAGHDFDLFIILNPLDESLLETQLLDLSKSKETAAELCQHPYRLHLLPFALYIDNWRWYFRHLGAGFEKQNDRIMTVGLDTTAAVALNFDRVRELRNLRDETFSMQGYCKSAIEILKTLDGIPANGLDDEWLIAPFMNRLEGYKESLSILASRVSNSIDLVSKRTMP